MSIIYIIILFTMLLFKEQARSLLSALVQLVNAIATSIVGAMKQ